jgi:WD40 repeat protein
MKQLTQYAGYVLFIAVVVIAVLLLGDRNEWRQMAVNAAATAEAVSTRYAMTEADALTIQGTATTASTSARATIVAGNAAAATLEAQLQEIQSLADSQLDHQTTLETDLAQQQQISQAYELALASQQLLDSSEPNSELAALLAVEAIRLHQNPYTFSALSRSLNFLPRFIVQMMASDRRTDRFLFTQDGSRLLTWGLDIGQQIPPTLWDTETGGRLTTMSDAGVLEISKEGRYLALYNWPDDPYIIDTVESQPAMSLPHPVYGIYGLGVGFNSDSTQVAYSMEIVVDPAGTTSSEKYNSIFVIQDIASGEIVLDVVISDSYNKISFSSDNRYVVGVNYPNIEIWELDTKQMMTQFSSTVSWPDAVLFSSDNRYLAIAGVEGLILWDMEQDQETPVEFLVGAVESVRFSHDSRYLVVTRQEQWDAGEGGAWYTGQNGTQVWDVTSGTEVLYLPHVNNDAGFIGDTNQLLTLDQAGRVEIWDVVTRKLVAQAQISGQITTGINPDGSRIASIDDQGQIRLWAIEPYMTTQILYPMTVANDYRTPDNLNSLIYSPDGSTLVTSSWDGEVRLWDTTSGFELDAFRSRSWIRGMTFSQDGTYMAIVGGDSPSPDP